LNAFLSEITGQPAALRDLVARYRGADMRAALGLVPPPRRVVFTGMGASFHAGLWASFLLQSCGIWAIAVEASELLHFSAMLLDGCDCIVVISQSGASAEVVPLLDRIPPGVPVVAVTNGDGGALARRGDVVLPIVAGSEATVATKTYLNTMAALWLLARAWGRGHQPADLAMIEGVADAVDGLIANGERQADAWTEALMHRDRVFFVGHGPHVATARQGAMMMGEWLKGPAVACGIGAFRHGLIEIADERCGVVVLGAGGATAGSVERLADELRSYGSAVLSVVEGWLAASDERAERRMDELLSPFLDVVPMQLYIESLARRLEIAPRFRRISKVITHI
jgi:glucosamine--fructose-6-phosphate aminotransferase (isomerizing)